MFFKYYRITQNQCVLGRGKLKLPKLVLLFAAGLLLLISPISAQEELQVFEDPLRAAELNMTFGEDTAPLAPVAGPSIWAIIRMVLVLVLVAIAIYGVVFLLKRSSKQPPNNDPFLKILANAHLGSNRYVHVVSVGSKTWLVGSSEGGVNPIGEVTDNDVINAMLLEDSRKSAEAPGRFPDFFSLLRRLGIPANTKTPDINEIRKRRERLQGL